MNPEKKSLQNEARLQIRWCMANSLSIELGTQLLFLRSREWIGYDKAEKSWQTGLWKWVDSQPFKNISCWRDLLNENPHLLPKSMELQPDGRNRTPSDLEVELEIQTYLSKRAVFLSTSSNRRKDDPSWWKRQTNFLHLAHQFKDQAVFERMVKLTQKRSKETGQRTLSDWLRLFWFPGCFWAFSNSAISNFIKQKTDDGDPNLKGAYDGESIRQAVLKLKLFHPVKPRHDNLNAAAATRLKS